MGKKALARWRGWSERCPVGQRARPGGKRSMLLSHISHIGVSFSVSLFPSLSQIDNVALGEV